MLRAPSEDGLNMSSRTIEHIHEAEWSRSSCATAASRIPTGLTPWLLGCRWAEGVGAQGSMRAQPRPPPISGHPWRALAAPSEAYMSKGGRAGQTAGRAILHAAACMQTCLQLRSHTCAPASSPACCPSERGNLCTNAGIRARMHLPLTADEISMGC